MPIRQNSNRGILLSILILASLLTLVIMLETIGLNLRNSEQRILVSYKISNELKQYSNKISESVRYYVNSGNSKYREQFERLLPEQSKQIDSIDNEDFSFLEEYKASIKPRHIIDSLNIDNYLITTDYTEDEMSLLRQIIKSEIALRDIHTEAIALYDAGLQEDAIALFNQNRYKDGKDLAVQDILNFIAQIEERSFKETENLTNDQLQAYKKYGWLIFVIMIGLVIENLWGKKNIIAPIEELSRIATRIKNGEYKKRSKVTGSNEVSLLASTFNEMAESIEADITHRKNSAQALKALSEKAEAANKAKSEFLANMSHEIRTPMNAILGFTEILSSMEDDSEKLHYINSMLMAGKNLLNIINNVLDLSKIEAGKMQLQYSAVSLVNMSKELNVLFGDKISKQGLEFIIFFQGDIPKGLILDEVRLQQVLINLIGNALKFTKHGHIKLSMEVTPSASSKEHIDLVISIEDTGIGLDDDQKSIIFDSFEQAKGQVSKDYGGTGLGLAITKKIISMMGGEITVTGEKGKGSTFTIAIPNIEISSQQLTIESNEDTSIAVEFSPAKILIVDDIDYNIEVLTLFLKDYSFTLSSANNGLEAIERASEIIPDIILLDMEMPVMDGYQAIEGIRKNKALDHCKIIAATASVFKNPDKISTICDGYLAKPISKKQLIQDLMRHLPYSKTIEDNSEPETLPLSNDHGSMPLPPVELIKELHELAIDGFLGDIQNKLLTIKEEYPEFNEKFESLALNFQDEEIAIQLGQILDT